MARLLLLLLGTLTVLRAAIDPTTMVVVANTRVPAGVELAREFSRHRGIPETNLIVLDLPTEETITWPQYSETLLNPLRAKLRAAGLLTGQLGTETDERGRRDYVPTAAPKLTWIVLMHGVPLKIRASGLKAPSARKDGLRGDQACIDSELALIATTNLDPDGAKPNPWFRHAELTGAAAGEVIRTARLDGPTGEDARRALRGAWRAEAQGLRGRAYIDSGGPYGEGDTWFKAAAETTTKLGFPTDVEATRQQFGPKARADAPAFYLGWYSQKPEGRFAAPDVPLAPGAIALHLHSFSAETLRKPTAGWTAWLVQQGAAQASGNVHEPYLAFTLRPDLLIQGLAQDLTAGEAAWFATPAVSWQGVILGDPFYRPFARSLEQQQADRRDRPDELSPYVALRAAQPAEAAQALAALEEAQLLAPSLPVAWAIAQHQAKLDLPIRWNLPPETDLTQADAGLLWETALFLEKNGLKDPARAMLTTLKTRHRWKDDPEIKTHLESLSR
jgi:uncharacterized protein (TIGR03790 family)